MCVRERLCVCVRERECVRERVSVHARARGLYISSARNKPPRKAIKFRKSLSQLVVSFNFCYIRCFSLIVSIERERERERERETHRERERERDQL